MSAACLMLPDRSHFTSSTYSGSNSSRYNCVFEMDTSIDAHRRDTSLRNQSETAGDNNQSSTHKRRELARQRLKGLPNVNHTIQQLQATVQPSSTFEATLLQDACTVAALCHTPDNRIAQVESFANSLAAMGYHAMVRRVMGSEVDGWVRPATHSFVIVSNTHEDLEYIVDPNFRECFRVAFMSDRYRLIWDALNGVFLGLSHQLVAVVQLLCEEVELSFLAAGRPRPPWRDSGAMCSRWISNNTFDSKLQRGEGKRSPGRDGSPEVSFVWELGQKGRGMGQGAGGLGPCTSAGPRTCAVPLRSLTGFEAGSPTVSVLRMLSAAAGGGSLHGAQAAAALVADGIPEFTTEDMAAASLDYLLLLTTDRTLSTAAEPSTAAVAAAAAAAAAPAMPAAAPPRPQQPQPNLAVPQPPHAAAQPDLAFDLFAGVNGAMPEDVLQFMSFIEQINQAPLVVEPDLGEALGLMPAAAQPPQLPAAAAVQPPAAPRDVSVFGGLYGAPRASTAPLPTTLASGSDSEASLAAFTEMAADCCSRRSDSPQLGQSPLGRFSAHMGGLKHASGSGTASNDRAIRGGSSYLEYMASQAGPSRGPGGANSSEPGTAGGLEALVGDCGVGEPGGSQHGRKPSTIKKLRSLLTLKMDEAKKVEAGFRLMSDRSLRMFNWSGL